MNLSDVKRVLADVAVVNFRLPDGLRVPQHFHVTEVGLITRHFIDCGGVERHEQVVNFQLWQAGDYDHRLGPQKFLKILELSRKVLGDADLPVEVEYQQGTTGKFGLQFDGQDFLLTVKETACLAQDACGIPSEKVVGAAPCCGGTAGADSQACCARDEEIKLQGGAGCGCTEVPGACC